MNRRLDLELRIGATLDCTYDLDGPYVAAVVDRSPDRCSPAEGGAVAELAMKVKDVCVEDQKNDLLTSASVKTRTAFLAALADLVGDYEEYTRTVSNLLEQLESRADDGR